MGTGTGTWARAISGRWGIGPEIMKATLEILDAAGAPIKPEVVEVGEKVYLSGLANGSANFAPYGLPDGTGMLFASNLGDRPILRRRRRPDFPLPASQGTPT